MKGIYAIAGIGVLAACLAGWAALAWAQPSAKPSLPGTPVVQPRIDQANQLPVPMVERASAAPVASSLPVDPLPVPPPAPSLSVTASPPATSVMVPVAEPTLPVSPVPVLPPPGDGPATPAPVILYTGQAPGTPPLPLTEPSVTPVADPVPMPVTLPRIDAQRMDVPKPRIVPPTEIRTGPAGIKDTASTPDVEERQPETLVVPDSANGRQEPAVSMEWVGPVAAKIGQPSDYNLVIRNICNIPVQQVMVRVRIPNSLSITGTEPRAIADNNVLVWELGTLAAKQEKSLQIKLVAEAKGDLAPQAWVTFTGSSIMRIKVREPKLVIKATAPEKVLVGDAAAFTLSVSNPGDGSADGVRIHALLSDGLEHTRGNKVDFEIGNLAAGESRNVTLICGTKMGGMQKCEGMAEADGGLRCTDAASVNVSMPRLDVQLTGPGLRYLDRKALYTLKVTNPGDAPATNVTVGDIVPAGFKVLAASDGGRHDFATRTVSWFLGEIGGGQTKEVKLEVQAVNPGEHRHKATVVGARGLRAEAELVTRVEGLSALLLEMVDTEDPIEVGGETAYEIRVTNTGSKTETDIKLVAVVPDKMEFKSSQGPVRFREEGKTIIFEPVEKLAPRADAVFRINVKALEAGTVRFKIQMTSTNLVEPVIKMEATRIYSDTPDAKP